MKKKVTLFALSLLLATVVQTMTATASDDGSDGQAQSFANALAFSANGSDTDLDGVPDAQDNCLLTPNPSQNDANGDGYGNACDADLNDDCVVNVQDLGLLRAVFFTADDAADFNDDDVVNVVDLGILRQAFFQPPGPSGQSNVCAPTCGSFVDDDALLRSGIYDGLNCVYGTDFASADDAVTDDLDLDALPHNGAHLFLASLPIGQSYASDADLAAAGIARGGDGPTLSVEAGATVAFAGTGDYLTINRGSQIVAVGRADAPITFTSLSDIDGTLPGFDAVQQWGGVLINGFGIANSCFYSGSMANQDLIAQECHLRAEGSTVTSGSRYGGDQDDDDSGHLAFVVVKHTGGTALSGDELNSVTFSAVGHGTTVRNLEVYATYDDGVELFGGSVDIENLVAVYVRDDSIDVDEGYSGTITNALLIQSETNGNRCIEADGIGSFANLSDLEVEQNIAQGINGRPTFRRVTCVLSPSPAAGDFDPGAGVRFREAVFAHLSDALIVSSFGVDSSDSNECLRIDNRSQQAAQDGDLTIGSTIFACEERTRSASLPDGTTVEQFALNSGNLFATISGQVSPTIVANPELLLLGGSPPVFALDYAQMVIDGGPAAGAPSVGTFIGALGLSGDNWIAGWTYGINEGARAAPLWFELRR